MGNTRSSHFEQKPDDVWWSNSKTNEVEENTSPCSDESVEIDKSKLSEDSIRKLDEFELELARKREKRKEILSQKKKEMEELREEVQRLKEENEALRRVQHQHSSSSSEENNDLVCENSLLRQDNETLKMLVQEKGRLLLESEKIIETNRELRVETADLQQELQRLNSVMLNFEKEKQDYKAHVVALKEVIAVSKNMLQIRETELTELKAKITEIEKSLAEKEIQLLSKTLRSEYERQMANIRDLRSLYEERQRAAIREKEEIVSKMNDAKKELEDEQNKTRELQERITELEDDNSKKYDEIKQLESNVGFAKAESRQYQAELTVINQLFSEVLLGFNSSQDIDLDKLQKHLEQHHDLLQDIVINEVESETTYALPKVLLDLVNQVEAKKVEEKPHEDVQIRNLETIEEETETATSTLHNQVNSAEEIVENLPKVWRVLIELLSHQMAPLNDLSNSKDTENPCYKTVETSKGPSVVLSVSQTFIRLKDLILEKKSLEKETTHLKQLNGHLENRLQDQEKRLELVHSELSKTWMMVGKLQKQHQMLHTQEKILRYELAQKRKLLTQLKEELEYSRDKWTAAREKNTNTEEQWKLLRTEFASRKKTNNDDSNNSAESGYSDDKECSSSDDESSFTADKVNNVPKKPEIARNLSGSTNTLTDVTVNTGRENTYFQDSSASTLADTDLAEQDPHISTTAECSLSQNENLSESVHTHNSFVNRNVTENSDNFESNSTQKIEPNLAANTWERVSDIVQKEIIRLTDQVQKNDCNVSPQEAFSSEEKLPGTLQQAENLRNLPSTSKGPSRSLEEVLAARNERFKRLEEQTQQLRNKVVKTNKRSNEISNKLDNLHETYGQSVDSSAGENIGSEDSQDNNETDISNLDSANGTVDDGVSNESSSNENQHQA